MAGWIKVYRQIMSHWLWRDPVKFQWWMHILMEANHEDKKVLLKNTLIECKRGQCVRSLDTWASDWRTTKKTVRSFFILLQKDSMITMESVTVSTRITVCKYEIYQQIGNDLETQGKRKVNAKETQLTPKQEGKELEEVKEVLPPTAETEKSEGFRNFEKFIFDNAKSLLKMAEPFTQSEYEKLRQDFTPDFIKDLLKRMGNYKPLVKNNVNANLTFRNWAKRDQVAGAKTELKDEDLKKLFPGL